MFPLYLGQYSDEPAPPAGHPGRDAGDVQQDILPRRRSVPPADVTV